MSLFFFFRDIYHLLIFFLFGIAVADGDNTVYLGDSGIDWLVVMIPCCCCFCLYLLRSPPNPRDIPSLGHAGHSHWLRANETLQNKSVADFTFVTFSEAIGRAQSSTLIKMSNIRWANAIVVFSSVAFNVYTVIENYATRPLRDSDVPLNFSTIFVAHFELWIVLLGGLFFIYGLLGTVLYDNNDRQHGATQMIRGFHYMKLSTFSLIIVASPQFCTEFWELTNHSAEKNRISGKFLYIGYLIQFVKIILCVFAAGAGFAVKLSQFNFILGNDPIDWNFSQWVSFLGFFNQISSMAVDDSVKNALRFIFGQGNGEMQYDGFTRQEQFKAEFFLQVVKTHGFKGFAFMITLDHKDISKLCCTKSLIGMPI